MWLFSRLSLGFIPVQLSPNFSDKHMQIQRISTIFKDFGLWNGSDGQ